MGGATIEILEVQQKILLIYAIKKDTSSMYATATKKGVQI